MLYHIEKVQPEGGKHPPPQKKKKKLGVGEGMDNDIRSKAFLKTTFFLFLFLFFFLVHNFLKEILFFN